MSCSPFRAMREVCPQFSRAELHTAEGARDAFRLRSSLTHTDTVARLWVGVNSRVPIQCRTVQVRDVAEDHVLEDLGRIPSVQDWLVGMPMYHWAGGPPNRAAKRAKHIPLED